MVQYTPHKSSGATMLEIYVVVFVLLVFYAGFVLRTLSAVR